jgi:hypothetical protein
MHWLLILEMAADGGALVSTAIAMLFGYRAATFTIKDDTLEADLQRQSVYAIYAVIASALATVSFAIALISI